jgi:transcriptional regulator with XRE-family HTH domain
MKIETTLGERLKQVRQRLKLKQSDLAEKLNISGPALSEIENDKYKPGHDFFYHAAKEFNINLYFLLLGEGDMFTNPGSGYSSGLTRYAASNSEVSKFLWYFEHSPIVQYFILGQFRRFFQKEKKEIELDIENYKKE